MFKLPYIPSAEKLVDDALRLGSAEAKKVRSTRKPRERRMRFSEEKRIQIISSRIYGELDAVVKQFPSYESLTPFYVQLFDLQIDKDKYKKSLGALSWVISKLKKLENESIHTLRRGNENASKHFMGKTSSLVTRVSKELDYLVEVKEVLKGFPIVKEYRTLVVAGFPNVGKSTFVRNLTGSKIKVASYPFTTQGIMIGYKKVRHENIQIIDSPGLLDRPIEDRNNAELKALLAISELADRILFIVDPTMELKPQIKLLEEISSNFDVGLIVGVNKIDVAGDDAVSHAKKIFSKFKVLTFTAQNPEDVQQVFKEAMNLPQE
ncbi:MAG: GTPase [Methanobacteriota archaeon]